MHWLTAVTFVILAITGLNITFGRVLAPAVDGSGSLQRMVGMGEICSQLSELSASLIGVVLMFLMWIGRNLPTAADVQWLKQGGGMFGRRSAAAPIASMPARK